MTPWGIELYKAGIVPDIRTLLATKVVPLVMDNDPMFTRLLTTDEPALEFKPEDAAAMRATYIHLWGPYWIAGANLRVEAKSMLSKSACRGLIRSRIQSLSSMAKHMLPVMSCNSTVAHIRYRP